MTIFKALMRDRDNHFPLFYPNLNITRPPEIIAISIERRLIWPNQAASKGKLSIWIFLYITQYPTIKISKYNHKRSNSLLTPPFIPNPTQLTSTNRKMKQRGQGQKITAL